MIYVDFRNELFEKLRGLYRNNGWSLKLYKEGDTANSRQELEFIHQTNAKYFGHNKDVLDGDFIKMSQPCATGGTSICRFEVKYLFEEFNKGGWEQVYNIIDMSIRSTDNAKYTIGNIDNYEEINNMLIARPLNYEKNKEALKGYIFRKIGDFAIVLYIRISEDKNNLISCKVPRSDFEVWNISEEQAIDRALENSSLLYPIETYISSGHSIENTFVDFILPADIENEPVDDTFTCTTVNKANGAVAIFYPGMMEKFYKVFGNEEYYVVLTSTTEFHLHRCSVFDPEKLHDTLLYSNARFPHEALSNMIYRYYSDKNELLPVSLSEQNN